MTYNLNMKAFLEHMVNDLLSGNDISFRDAITYLLDHDINPASLAMPHFPDKVRTAVAACVVERMVEVFSSPPHNKNVSIPGWVKDIKPLPYHLNMMPEGMEAFSKNEIFQKKKILVLKNFMFFV